MACHRLCVGIMSLTVVVWFDCHCITRCGRADVCISVTLPLLSFRRCPLLKTNLSRDGRYHRCRLEWIPLGWVNTRKSLVWLMLKNDRVHACVILYKLGGTHRWGCEYGTWRFRYTVSYCESSKLGSNMRSGDKLSMRYGPLPQGHFYKEAIGYLRIIKTCLTWLTANPVINCGLDDVSPPVDLGSRPAALC